jgi:serine/threonine-protein kinase
MKFAPGDTIEGRYAVGVLLSDGETGALYRARDLKTDKDVAVKVHAEGASGESLQRLKRSARLMTRISDPNVVRVVDYLFSEQGEPILVTEFVDGPSLRALLDETKTFAWPDALELMGPVLSGLDALHTMGVVHRNVKPETIMVAPGPPPDVKLVGFGLAKSAWREERRRITIAGSPVGNPAYMSPEQLAAGEASPKSDVYAAGLVLYELLTGRLPEEGREMKDLLRRIRFTPAPPEAPEGAPPLSDQLKRLVLWALDPDPNQRPASAWDLSEALGGLREG